MVIYMGIYFREDKIFFVDKSLVINKIFKSLLFGRIIDKNLFINEFNEFLKINNIKIGLIGSKLKIVKNAYFNLSDIYFLEQIFLDMGFLKIEFLDINTFYLNKEDVYIELNQDYLVYKNNIYILNDINNLKVFLSLILPCDVNIVLYGNNPLIPKIVLKDKNIYYVDNYENFIVDALKK